jgi:hypothetical protein
MRPWQKPERKEYPPLNPAMVQIVTVTATNNDQADKQGALSSLRRNNHDPVPTKLALQHHPNDS